MATAVSLQACDADLPFAAVSPVKASHAWFCAALCSGFLLWSPVVLAFSRIKDRLYFNMFAADAMYYLGTAQNAVKFGFPSFDGVNITNGFHPLWELILVCAFKILPIAPHQQLSFMFFLCMALTHAAYACFIYLLIRKAGLLAGAAAGSLMFPGFFTLVLEPATHFLAESGLTYSYGPWSVANGLETPLSLVLMAAFFVLLHHRLASLAEAPLTGAEAISWPARIVLALIVMARLDDVLFCASVALFVLVAARGGLLQRLWGIFAVFWPAVLLLVVYLLINRFYFFSWLPVSGAKKTGLFLARNAPLHRDAMLGLGGSWWIYQIRSTPVIASIGLGLLISFFGLSRSVFAAGDPARIRREAFGVIIGAFLLSKGIFYLVMVAFIAQGYWYYLTMIACLNFMVASCVLDWLPGLRLAKPAFAAIALAFFALVVGNSLGLMSSTQYNYGRANPSDIAWKMWGNSDEIRGEILKRKPEAKLLDTWDGMFGCLLQMPAESITGLVSSKAELERRAKIGLWPQVLESGANVMPNYGYINLASVRADMKLLYKDKITGVDFYEISPHSKAVVKNPSPAAAK